MSDETRKEGDEPETHEGFLLAVIAAQRKHTDIVRLLLEPDQERSH